MPLQANIKQYQILWTHFLCGHGIAWIRGFDASNGGHGRLRRTIHLADQTSLNDAPLALCRSVLAFEPAAVTFSGVAEGVEVNLHVLFKGFKVGAQLFGDEPFAIGAQGLEVQAQFHIWFVASSQGIFRFGFLQIVRTLL